MCSFHQKIGEWLGVKPQRSEQQLVALIEHQLSASSIKRLIALGIAPAEVDLAVIPRRRFQRRLSRSEKLTVDESDRLIRLLRILADAERVYGSLTRALAWLRTPVATLGGRAPIRLLRTGIGTGIVEEALVQSDEGMYI